MNRTLAGFLVLSVVGCASGGGPATTPAAGGGPVTGSVSVAGGSGNDRLRFDNSGSGPVVNNIEASVDRVWRVLPAALDSLGITITRVDQAQKIIGNDGYRIRQNLKRVPLSRYIDCGQTQIGPNADSYEVWMIILVQVRPVANSTTASTLSTTFETSARPLSFSQAYSRCTTRGQLEQRLVAAVQAQLK